MNLKKEAIWQRLDTLLKFHQKLQMENTDRTRIEQVGNKITQLIHDLETLNQSKMAQTIHPS